MIQWILAIFYKDGTSELVAFTEGSKSKQLLKKYWRKGAVAHLYQADYKGAKQAGQTRGEWV